MSACTLARCAACQPAFAPALYTLAALDNLRLLRSPASTRWCSGACTSCVATTCAPLVPLHLRLCRSFLYVQLSECCGMHRQSETACGLHSAVVGELDEDLDQQLNLSQIRAAPLKPVQH